ncbi:cobalt-precorrin 5A hydrolase [Butyrivibrio sp. VCB2001]|uniref:cobalt-precorrin 5A hydrolase n=1 Tax=Butyrivibrio sp. VCB2001 TaxID=1280667 RepID=UPI00040CB99A|nr:cobalt-precorrin 5A hydrolase [Butyrivibrio sp. VCB2001]
MDRASKNKYKFICFTAAGRQLMEKILLKIPGETGAWGPDKLETGGLSDWTKENFKKGNVLVFIGACGIAVRAIAQYITDKAEDPAVIVIDEEGRFVIPILSGHLGGGVAAAKELSDIIGATAVITTASDVRGEFAVDVFAKNNGLVINDMKKAKSFSAYLLEHNKAFYRVDPEFEDVFEISFNRDSLIRVKDLEELQEGDSSFTISPKTCSKEQLQLIPKCIVLGVGCRKGKEGRELIEFADRILDELSLDKRSVLAVASIDLKSKEAGIIELAESLGAEFKTFSQELLMQQKGEFSASQFVRETTGADNVCERSVMAFGCKRLIMKKRAENGMTLAVGVFGRSFTDE